MITCMNTPLKIRLYGGLLTLFGLFAVYSTSIWKSFDQRLNVTIIQNIETIKAFNTYLDETILSATQTVLEKAVALLPASSNENLSGQELSGAQNSSVPAIPILSTLETEDEEIQLVAHEKKKVQNRNNYVLFSNQLRSLFVALLGVALVLLIPLPFFKEKKLILAITVGVFIFQMMVFMPGIGATNRTARGWVDIPGLPNMQPAEFFKLGYVFFMSYWLTKKKQLIEQHQFLLQFGAINAIILLIILAIPDF